MIARRSVLLLSCLLLWPISARGVEVKAVGNGRIVFGGTSKPGPFRITPRSLILMEVVGSSEMLAKGQVVDLAGTVSGSTFTATKILIHSRPNLTAKRRSLISARAVFVKGQNKPLPATVTGSVESANPLIVKSLGRITNTYQMKLRPGNPASVPLRTTFPRAVFNVTGNRIKVLLTQTPGLLKAGMSLKRHETQGAFLKSIYAYSSEKITREQFDQVMGIRRPPTKKKTTKKKTGSKKSSAGNKSSATRKND